MRALALLLEMVCLVENLISVNKLSIIISYHFLYYDTELYPMASIKIRFGHLFSPILLNLELKMIAFHTHNVLHHNAIHVGGPLSITC